jgi:hypothetical protein
MITVFAESGAGPSAVSKLWLSRNLRRRWTVLSIHQMLP